MPIRFFILFYTLFYLHLNLSAQILNADGFIVKADSAGQFFRGAINLGLSLNKQNVMILSIDSRGDFSFWFKDNVLTSVSRYNRVRTNSQDLVNMGFSHLRFRMQETHWIHPEVFAQYQHDGIRGMEQRILLGSNARFRLTEYEKGASFLGLGMMYEYEKWSYRGVPAGVVVPVSPELIYRHLPKINLYWSHRQKIGEVADFQGIIYFQASPDRYITRPRISSDAQLSFKINKHFSFAVRYNIFFDAAPPVPIFNWYYTITNNILINF